MREKMITQHQQQSICKYYKKEYNIIRNDQIGIGHVLALKIYTDCSQFCSVFRGTFRKINAETKTKEVEERHRQLYHYSRFLFEAVEFYGKAVNSKLTLYHGLSKPTSFGRFTAYFNQPISLTPSITKAQEFSKGSGIILQLRVNKYYGSNRKRVPKYQAVSFLSNYPEEQEKLVYGLHGRFQICDIIEVYNHNKSHVNEVSAFVKFQELLDGFEVHWDTHSKAGKDMIDMITKLIHNRQRQGVMQREDLEDEEKREIIEVQSITTYGYELFSYFCQHQDRHTISIKNFKSIPSSIYELLFGQFI